MLSQLFIENYELDISKDFSSLLTFELDNVKDFAARSTTWSKTIILPGTARNNKLFGHIFKIGQSNSYNSALPNVNYNFNASKSANCIIFQDHLQTFRGVLRLMQINTLNGNVEYEVGLFGKLASLSVDLSGAFLNDLDFSAYDHAWTVANIIASWDNTPGSGYYYPLIDYGMVSVDKINYDVRTFRPALYVKEFIDKIFEQHGYRYSSDLMDTARFKSLVIPHNKKDLTDLNVRQLLVSRDFSYELPAPINNIKFPILNEMGSFTSSIADTRFTYGGAGVPSCTIVARLIGDYYAETDNVTVSIKINGVAIKTELLDITSTTELQSYDITITALAANILTSDYVEVEMAVSTGVFSIFVNADSYLQIISDSQVSTLIDYGSNVTMNDVMPQQVRQIDFLTGIVKLFNLYIYEDRFDSNLFYITPYVDFYDTSSLNAVDWTYKLNREKAVKVRPMSEINAKKYNFRFKQDDDYWNRLYRERYREGYGDYIYYSDYEFADAENTLEVTFSATPLVGYTGKDKIVCQIIKRNADVEEKIDTNIRIMQTKKITGVDAWVIYDGGDQTAPIQTDITSYGYAGHFDDPDAPSNDLNFGAARELFFILATGDLSNTQFNIYWSSYMAEITDKDSKLLSARFYLTPKDILELDFSKLIVIDGVLFRLNSIKDYNVSEVSDCEVELIKVNYLIR